jgi:hypothetical protein
MLGKPQDSGRIPGEDGRCTAITTFVSVRCTDGARRKSGNKYWQTLRGLLAGSLDSQLLSPGSLRRRQTRDRLAAFGMLLLYRLIVFPQCRPY